MSLLDNAICCAAVGTPSQCLAAIQYLPEDCMPSGPVLVPCGLPAPAARMHCQSAQLKGQHAADPQEEAKTTSAINQHRLPTLKAFVV